MVKFTNDPLKVVGDGSCLILEWSQPTTVALVRAIHHIKCEYKLFSSSSDAKSGEKRDISEEKSSPWQSLLKELPPVDLKFRMTDINGFLYSLVPGTC